jgi:hypothetical protein
VIGLTSPMYQNRRVHTAILLLTLTMRAAGCRAAHSSVLGLGKCTVKPQLCSNLNTKPRSCHIANASEGVGVTGDGHFPE